MDQSFKSLIDTSQSLLILLPRDPYFDQVAAGLSLFLSLKDKKNVAISCPTPMLVEFNRLVGVQKITSDLGSKNLVIRLTDYSAESIDKVAYDINNGVAEIVVSPRAQNEPPSKEKIAVTYSGVSAEVAILVGGLNDKHFPQISTPDFGEIKLAHIGIQEINIEGKTVMSFAEGAASVSEVAAKLIKALVESFEADVATNLLMGMHEGSRSFTHPEVTAKTFEIAAELMNAGGKHNPKDKVERTQFPQGVLPHERPQLERTVSDSPEMPGAGSPPPMGAGATPPSWFQPKIYKGTSVS